MHVTEDELDQLEEKCAKFSCKKDQFRIRRDPETDPQHCREYILYEQFLETLAVL
jgi:hypothetical protein